MELSIVIPSRCEIFLRETIGDILKNIEADTEIIAVLDGEWANPPIPINERVNIIYVPKSIGQRATANMAVRMSKAKYVMKVDAHCSFDKGFDRKMIDFMKKVGEDVVAVPVMRNLWAFDWKCYKCGWKKYQGPTPTECPDCGETKKIKRKMIWKGKERPQSKSYCFDSEPHFQYFNDYTKRPAFKKSLEENGYTETMSLQGSCFMSTREKYWEWELCDEKAGSWGNQGLEVAAKARLAGGRVLVNYDTWYAHMFRTQGGDFSFPYEQRGRVVQKTKKYIRDLFWENKWGKQIYPLSKIVEQFWPVKGWTDDDLKKLKKEEMKVKKSGIYYIKSLINNKIYIGSAKDLSSRFLEHVKSLKCGNHHNAYLQNTWDKHGEDNLEFGILYFCTENNLIKKEQEFINVYKEKIGWDNMFNINPTAGSSLGHKHSKETKDKISLAQSA